MPLTEQAVGEIVAMSDPAVRNLWITQSYADLAHRMLRVLATDQTWCTFAIWASRTAGESIRGEELPRRVSELLLGADTNIDALARGVNRRTSIWRRLGLVGELQRSHLEHLVAEALAQVAGFIANGNTLVYSELAPLFVRFAERIERNGAPADDQIASMLADGGVPPDEHVHLAFEHYALAAACADDRRRAQHVLTGNIAAVLHEQQRLQPDIAAALDAGLVDFGDDLAGVVSHWLPRPIRRRLVAAVRAHVADDVELLWQHVATRLLMTLVTPGQTLRLGDPLPPLPDGEPMPAALRQLDLPELRALFDEWGPTESQVRAPRHGVVAGDWANLHDRMRYIVELFRSRQRLLSLTAPPFDAPQLASLANNEVAPSL
jgi:hypothetical protein